MRWPGSRLSPASDSWIDKVGGRGPWDSKGTRFPAGVPDRALADFDFYARVAPKGRGYEFVKLHLDELPLVPGAEFLLRVDEWFLYMNAQGEVITAQQGDAETKTPKPSLVKIR